MDTNRRGILKFGGAVSLGTALSGCALARGKPAPVVVASPPPREKPTYVPTEQSPLAYSRADNLFWNDIMMEHALFFTLLMPGPELAGPRSQAEEFQRLFARQFTLSQDIRADNMVTHNRSTIALVQRFSDYKKTLREQQATGKIRSLVWPLFFQHTAREADRFAMRLDLYNRRQIELDRNEVIDFWSLTMGEHSAFIAHLLDPDERELIKKASKMEKVFLGQNFPDVPGDDVMGAAQEILDFKVAGEEGIYAGKIKSIIPPPLASHVKREAMKFIHELKHT